MLTVEQWPIERLIPYARNPRHNDAVLPNMMAAIKEFGFRIPIVAKSDGTVVDGHLRLKAGLQLGLTDVPVALADELTEAQVKAFRLLANKSANWAEWDDDLLTLELKELDDLDFDLSLTGFSAEEIDEYLNDFDDETESSDESESNDEPDESVPPITKLGDVWVLGGKHRVMCGDSTAITDVDKLMDGNSIAMVYTDPPYGISIVSGGSIGGSKPFGSVGGGKLAKVGKYEPIAGDDTIDVAVSAIGIIKTLGADVEIIWGGNYYASYLDNSSCWIVWDKQNTGNFADAELAWTNQDTAVRIFQHMWNGMIKASEHGGKRIHPTQKPVALAEWCFEHYGEKCDTVLDLFGGSGSTLMACESKSKTGYIMELSPHYIDKIVQRWIDKTGGVAVLESTGEVFNNG